jgi:hypothetical protein
MLPWTVDIALLMAMSGSMRDLVVRHSAASTFRQAVMTLMAATALGITVPHILLRLRVIPIAESWGLTVILGGLLLATADGLITHRRRGDLMGLAGLALAMMGSSPLLRNTAAASVTESLAGPAMIILGLGLWCVRHSVNTRTADANAERAP